MRSLREQRLWPGERGARESQAGDTSLCRIVTGKQGRGAATVHTSSALSFQVGLVALGFAWRRRDDPHFFTESLRAATKDLDSELEEHARSRVPLRASQMEEVRSPSRPHSSPFGPISHALWIQIQLHFGV